MPALNTTPHEVTDACWPVHCWGHDIDEAPRRTYRACGECFHAYPSARALRRARAAGHREGIRQDWRKPRTRITALAWPGPAIDHDGQLISGIDLDPFATENGWTRPTRWALAWSWLAAGMIRASKIYFCPVCIHDF